MGDPKDLIVGFVSIGIGIAASFIPVVGPYIGSALFYYGTNKIIEGIQPQREQVVSRIQGLKVNVRSTQASIPVIYGRARVGLKINDLRLVSGADPISPNADPTSLFTGTDNNDVLAKVGVFCLGSEDGSGIQAVTDVRVYEDGIDAITGALSFSAAPSDTGVIGRYAGHLKYILEDGDNAQNTRTELEDALGWGSNMNGAGLAYGAFFFKYNEGVWTKGVPQITAFVTGNRVYDPRSSTWIGYAASGASADNPALCVLDYLTSKRYGAGVPYAARDGGSLDFIDEQSFIDAANYCDDLVSIPGPATEKRFTLNGAVITSRVVGTNLAELLATCRGELVWQGGKYRMIISQVTTPESFELTEDEIVGDIEWVRKGSSIPNIIEATFPDAQGTDFVPNSVVWPLTGDTTFFDEDNGVENRVEVALPFTTGYYQALRTIMTLLREARNDVLASLTATQDAFTLQVGDVVRVTHDGPGWVQEEFTVKQVALTANGLVRLSLQQYTSGAYTLDSLTAQPSTPTFNLPDPLRPAVWSEFIYERPQSLGPVSANQAWRREISWAVGKNVRSVEIERAGYLIQPTLDSGVASPTNVPAYRYHVDVAPESTTVELLTLIESTRSVFFTAVDSHILLDNTNNGVAQNFTPLIAGELIAMSVELQRVGNPTGDVVMKLYDDSASLPGTVLATSYPVPARSISTALNDEVLFSFPAGTNVDTTTTYHAAVEYSVGDASNYIQVGIDAGGGLHSGTSKILNGSWAENGPVDMPHGAWVASGVETFGTRYDENNLLIGAAGQITLTITPYSLEGGQAARTALKGIAQVQVTKKIPEYDDIGIRAYEDVDRRIDFSGEAFGSPGPGPNDLSMNDLANGFAFDYTPGEDHDLGQVAVYLKKTGAPSGNIVAKVYSDSGGLPGSVLATSETIDVSSFPTSYPSNDPVGNGMGFVFNTPASLTNGTLYHISVEYSGGDATNYVSVAAETSGGHDELNGSWAAGGSDQITWRVYARETVERIARSATAGTNMLATLNQSTGEIELSASLQGSIGALDDLSDVAITAAAEGQVLYRNATEWVNTDKFTIGSGAVGTPTYSFLADPDTGTYLAAVDDLRLAVGGADKLRLQPAAVTALQPLLIQDGSFTNPGLAFASDADTGLYLPSAASLNVVTAGATRAVFGTAQLAALVDVVPNADSLYDLGTTTERWATLFVDDITLTNALQFPDGTSAAPSITFANDPDTGVYRVTTNTLGFATFGASRLEISDTFVHIRNLNNDEQLRLNHASASGSPYLSLYQADVQRVTLQFVDAGDELWVSNLAGNILLAPTGNNRATVTLNPNLILANNTGDEQLRIDHGSATGSPYVSIFQLGTRRAYLQYTDSGDALVIANEYGELHLYAGAGGVETNELIISQTQLRIVEDGAVGTPALAWNSDLDTGFYRPGADQLAMTLGGTYRLFATGVDASGGHLQANAAQWVSANVAHGGGSSTEVDLDDANTHTFLNDQARTITIKAGTDRLGATFIWKIAAVSGAAQWTFPTEFDWGAAGAPTLSTTLNKVDLIWGYCDGTTIFVQAIIGFN